MRRFAIKVIVIFTVFFAGTCGVVAVDTICHAYTGYGGKMVLPVEKTCVFN